MEAAHELMRHVIGWEKISITRAASRGCHLNTELCSVGYKPRENNYAMGINLALHQKTPETCQIDPKLARHQLNDWSDFLRGKKFTEAQPIWKVISIGRFV